MEWDGEMGGLDSGAGLKGEGKFELKMGIGSWSEIGRGWRANRERDISGEGM